MFWIDVLSRIIHVATAIVLLGGSVFTALVLLPEMHSLNEEVRSGLAAKLRQRWKRYVHAGIALFLLSGFYNYLRAMPHHRGDGLYHALIGTKILLALAVFFLASALVGRSSKFENLRKHSAGWSLWICVLGAVIVTISGWIKVSNGWTD